MAEYICPADPEITHCCNAAKVRELIRQARIDALEEAAKGAEAKADEWCDKWRKGLKCDAHLEGMSDGADDVAVFIRSLKEKQPA